MSRHMFPTYRTEHDNPESFLTVAGAILAALVILLALAAVAVAGAVVWDFKITTPTPPGIAMPDRLDTRFGTLHLTMLSSVIPNRVLVRFEGVVNDRANAGVFADRRHSTA